MPERSGAGAPPPQERRIRNRPPEYSEGVNQIFEGVRDVHTRYADNLDFRRDFYANTTTEIKRLQTMFGTHYVTPSGIELGILAEINATQTAELMQKQKEAEKTSLTDPLTGTYNRRGLEKQFKELSAVAKRTNQKLTLVQFDLDHFKQINDTLGHPAGDAVIKGAANHVADALRDDDIVARVGGEEFYLILMGTTPETAKNKLEEIREGMPDSLRNALRLHDETISTDHPLTASWGMAEILPDSTLEEVQEQVDKALYTAKKRGRNRVVGIEDLGPDDIETAEISLAEIQELALAHTAQTKTEYEQLPPPRWVQQPESAEED